MELRVTERSGQDCPECLRQGSMQELLQFGFLFICPQCFGSWHVSELIEELAWLMKHRNELKPPVDIKDEGIK